MKRRRNNRRLHIQQLDKRQLMAGDLGDLVLREPINIAPSAQVSDTGVLEVKGTGKDDRIELSEVRRFIRWGYSGGRFYPVYADMVRVEFKENAPGNPPVFMQAEFSKSQINSIDARVYGGRDFVDNGTSVTSRIDGGEGPDRLLGGSAQDQIYGGGGDDRLEGRDGDDYLYGDDGDDTLLGGNGIDRLYGQGGNDELRGGDDTDYLYGSVGDDSLNGGDGRDFLYGSYGNDTLRGENGSDFLYGSYGNDELDGGDGVDYLYGQADNDNLHGGSSTDYLFGGSGNDNLYGGSNSDFLFGQAGADGLYGDSGADYLNGGSGGDRFLVLKDVPRYWWFISNETIADFNDEDARINFENGAERHYEGTDLGEGRWSHPEIRELDEAFAALSNSTNNAALLKKADGGEFTFIRQGTTSSTWWGIYDGGRITLNDLTFETNNRLIETALHEIGHAFDSVSENAYIPLFRAESGWRQLGWWESKAGYDYSGNDGWWYREDAMFVANYARESPLEDWGETFAAYFMNEMGLSFGDGSALQIDDVPGKAQWVSAFVDSKSA